MYWQFTEPEPRMLHNVEPPQKDMGTAGPHQKSQNHPTGENSVGKCGHAANVASEPSALCVSKAVALCLDT